MAPRNKQTNPPTPPTTVEPAPPPSMELLVLENNLVFQWNVAEVKAALQVALQKYTGLVVTEENLPDMERTQKEIAGLRIKVDTFRKETKKKLAEPATVFDKEVQDLLVTIEEVEKPIKEQIAKYEDERVEKRTSELTAFAKTYAASVNLRDEYFVYEVPARLTNRTVSDSAAKKEITVVLDQLVAKQGEDDAVKAEQLRKDEETAELLRQRDAMIDLLCKSNSAALGLKTPITLEDIRPLIADDTSIACLPDLIVAECRKRYQVETAAAAPAPAAEYVGVDPAAEGGDRTVYIPPPVAWGPPPPLPPPAAAAPVDVQPQLFEVVLKFPAISIVNAGALKLWLSDAGIGYEVISQEPVKGVE